MNRITNPGRTVREVMTSRPVTVRAEDSVQDALDLMMSNRIATMPVVDEANRCVGVISASDLLEVAPKCLGYDDAPPRPKTDWPRKP